jgi:hypothetical protein
MRNNINSVGLIKTMNLTDFSFFERFRQDRFVKVLRHKDSRQDLWQLRKSGKFGNYQNVQSRDIFGNARYIISFIAEGNRYAKFVGVWEVFSKKKKKWKKGFRYRTKELPGFESLAGRLIVLWGEGTRSWAQWLHKQGNKKIVELLPPNYVMDFPGYYNFTLSFDQLATMVNNPDSNREWQRMLVSVSGVYLVLDQKTGKIYVGSAYGKGGIWGRWLAYVKDPSGGNKLLKELLKKHPDRHTHFKFSILRVLEPSATKEEVITQEVLTKEKLGSRAFGLNSN